MVTALDRKLLRDLLRLKGQVATIALVVAAGIAGYITMRSAWSSLEAAKSDYYQRFRFPDLFTTLERAPLALGQRIGELPGVALAYPRIVHPVTVPIEEDAEPAIGQIVSLPPDGEPPLGDLYLRSGRLPEPGRADEAVVLDTFFTAHDLELGDTVPAVIGGRLRHLKIVGVAMSPEFMFVAAAGEFAPDDKRMAILWMERSVVEQAFGLEGAFNDLVVRVQPGASEQELIRRIDLLLEPYGGLGTVTRAKQPSNFMLEGELAQLRQFATVVPIIFLAVAAFLLNIVLARLVNLQRQQIAVLKAIGYRSTRIGLHYFEVVILIVVLGAFLGVIAGAWLGSELTDLYSDFFRFPVLEYRLGLADGVVAILVSLLAGGVGAVATVKRVVSLPPAEAMRPPAPASYRASVVDRIAGLAGQSATLVVRELRRRPIRTLASSLGIAASIGIMVVGRFGYDSFEHLASTTLHNQFRSDTTVSFYQAQPAGVVGQLAGIPGVLSAEGSRVVPVRFRAGPRYRDSSIAGYGEPPRLHIPVDRQGDPVPIAGDGIALSSMLARVLDIAVGDPVVIEVREGKRQVIEATVGQLIDDSFGLQGYMSAGALDRMLGQEPTVSVVYLETDPLLTRDILAALRDMPQVASVSRTDNLVERFHEQSGQTMLVMTLIMTLFGTIIAIGVIYNNARIALSVRSRDLASLRVLGFTRRQIAAILLGEISIQIALAIPLGMALGSWWARAIMSSVDPETYRMALIISDRTYLYAILVTIAAGTLSWLLIRHKLDHLDLIGVLKTRE